MEEENTPDIADGVVELYQSSEESSADESPLVKFTLLFVSS